MLKLITGLPGAGKTLNVIHEASQIQDRPVYYFGIELTEKGKNALGWIEMDDGKKWNECPTGSVIIIDECQQVFRNRHPNSEPPAHVSPLETHRHKGYDFYLMTQHPKLIDFEVRRLTGAHVHLVRPFGMERATVLEWAKVRDDFDTSYARSEAASSTSKPYPKEIFEYYKSAEVHTVKRRIPKKMYFVAALVIGLLLAIYAAVQVVGSIGSAVTESLPGAMKEALPSNSEKPGFTASRSSPIDEAYEKNEVLKLEYIMALQPVIPGKPETAPIYHGIQEPQTFPRLQCLIFGKTCLCYTQQATRYLEISQRACRERVHHGSFNPTRPDVDRETNDKLAMERLDKLLARAYPDRTSSIPIAPVSQVPSE